MALQLLQLLAAVRSPGAANEHQYGGPTTEYVGEPNCLAVAGLQREWRCRIANAEACYFLGHLSSSGSDTQRVCAPFALDHHMLPLVQTPTLFWPSPPRCPLHVSVLCSYHRMRRSSARQCWKRSIWSSTAPTSVLCQIPSIRIGGFRR